MCLLIVVSLDTTISVGVRIRHAHTHMNRLQTVIDLAVQNGIELPSYTVEGLRESVFKESFGSLVEYLECFKYTTAVLQTGDALERCAYELACDNFNENVLYFEVRFAPQLHASPSLDISTVLQRVNAGLARAKAEYNSKESVTSGAAPSHEYGIIVCGMRFFNEHFSSYFADFIRVHRFEPEARLRSLATTALITAALHARDEAGIPIVALDIAGAENGYPAEDHSDAYQLAHKNFLGKTVHAGEAYGPESIFQAITDLHADRIGHGYFLFAADKVTSRRRLEDADKFVEDLAQYVAEHRITMEVCLTSNLQV